MCNRYSADIRKANLEFEVFGFEELSETRIELFPDRVGPVVVADDEHGLRWREMRWGFPPPPKGSRAVTNVRNLESPFWRGWLKPEHRCLVPFSQFAEWTDEKPKKERWFAVPHRPLAWFAGIWRPWTGTRGTKSDPVEGEHLLYAFLTCEPNEVVRPIHSKAMPVILANEDECRAWMEAPVEAVPTVARPLDDEKLELLAA